MHNYGANELLANWSARVLTPFMLCSTDSERAGDLGISRHSVIDNKTGRQATRRQWKRRDADHYTERHSVVSRGSIYFFLGVPFAISILPGCTAAVVWPTGQWNCQENF